MNPLSFLIEWPFRAFPFCCCLQKNKPCVAPQPLEEQHVQFPGDITTAEKARTKLHLQPWMCGMLIHSDKEASGPLPLRQSCERFTESQKTTPELCSLLIKGNYFPGAFGKLCYRTWLKHWLWMRHSHLKTSVEWYPWYPPTARVKYRLCKYKPQRFSFKHQVYIGYIILFCFTHQKRT